VRSSDEYPVGSRLVKDQGWHSYLATPLLREGAPIGTILVRRMEVRPFSDKQIALIETFADQAAIAIANVRMSCHKDRLAQLGRTQETIDRASLTEDRCGRICAIQKQFGQERSRASFGPSLSCDDRSIAGVAADDA
jgi:GAF domain-containing protein